ncbi:hypothetical protein FQK23_07520 [Corynebacterium aurimucosum]|uniref:Uncharacterized protein n=1 Tax=Corynebacterium aurimucosum TaxID=169292 RepID=A0A558GI44_9CORY|nr:hypothetical protein FQK23_07520 [Corynebacterium aurimucosum]
MLRQRVRGRRKISDMQCAVTVEHAPALGWGDIEGNAQAWFGEENLKHRDGFLCRIFAERDLCGGLRS